MLFSYHIISYRFQEAALRCHQTPTLDSLSSTAFTSKENKTVMHIFIEKNTYISCNLKIKREETKRKQSMTCLSHKPGKHNFEYLFKDLSATWFNGLNRDCLERKWNINANLNNKFQTINTQPVFYFISLVSRVLMGPVSFPVTSSISYKKQ